MPLARSLANSARILALLFTIGAAAGAGASAQEVQGVSDTTIKIGSLGAMTGPYYLYGDLVMDGAEMVYRIVNEAGGIHGRKIEFLREDDRCDSQTGIAAARKLIYQDKVFMIHGGGCSNPSIAAHPEIAAAKMPWVIFASVADSLTNPPEPYIWRTVLSATVEGQAQVQYAIDQGAKRIAILFMNDPWGRDRMGPVREQFKKNDVTPVMEEEITVDANDATPQALRMMQNKVDAVILVVYPKPASIFLRDSFKVGFKPLAVGTTAISGLDKIKEQVGMGDKAVERVVAINHVLFTQDEAPMLIWKKVFKQYYPQKEWTIYPLFGIPSALVVVEALQRAGRDLTRDRFKEAMDGMQDYRTGLSGPITCTPEDHQCNKTAALVTLRDGKLVTQSSVTVR